MAAAYASFLFPRGISSFPQPPLHSCFSAFESQFLVALCCSSFSCAAPTSPELLPNFICIIVLCLLPLCCVQVLYLKSAQPPASLSPDTLLLCPDFPCTLPLLSSCNSLCSDLCLVHLLHSPLVPVENKLSLPLGVCGHKRRQKAPSRDHFLLYLLCPSVSSCSAVHK